ncbi:DNA-binding protein [Pseudomonas sp. SL4(2022)]|uniref:DNA-binding protein n=1 Tax=unclassified Pseudomonas TaxID=196821 RepID=UPI002114896A|nr:MULTISPECIES: DNA-binding protein [unclassified Pseudomonas]WAC43526.1 DNA-binding protein [Pseudomonas sp. SL4(2022)]
MGLEVVKQRPFKVWLDRDSTSPLRLGIEEIDVLVKIYPQYVLWLASGQIAPESGQTSPDYDEANRNLNQPNAG